MATKLIGTACCWVGPDLLGREIAGVGLFQQPHPGIVTQRCIHLPVASVDRDNLGRAVLQKAVGEAAGGRADVHAGLAMHVDVPILQRARQLQATATYKWQVVTQHADHSAALDISARLFDLLFVHQHPSGENERLRALSCRHQPAFHQQFVEPRSHAARLARPHQEVRRAMNSDSVVISHLAQGRVPDVSNCEELSDLRIALFHKLMHICVENVVGNSSEPQPGTFSTIE